jgi:hypothetical protein
VNPYTIGSTTGSAADSAANSAANPYTAGSTTGSAESDGVLSQYTTADRTNVSDLADTGIDFPGTGSTSSDSIPDSYPDTSIDDYSRE